MKNEGRQKKRRKSDHTDRLKGIANREVDNQDSGYYNPGVDRKYYI
jgi:hypothetical protein